MFNITSLILAVLAYMATGFVANFLVYEVFCKKRLIAIFEHDKNLIPKDFSKNHAMISGNVLIFISGIFLAILLKFTKTLIPGTEWIHGFIMGLLVWMCAMVPSGLMWIMYVKTPRDLMSINFLAWFFLFTFGGMFMNIIL
ncbi:MAG: DUF1761 family protein [Patescibacteria group bacterium]